MARAQLGTFQLGAVRLGASSQITTGYSTLAGTISPKAKNGLDSVSLTTVKGGNSSPKSVAALDTPLVRFGQSSPSEKAGVS